MNIKRFFGPTSKDALAQVRKALGKDAVILSNRGVDGGHEIMAFREEDMQALIVDEMQEDGIAAPAAPEPALQAAPAKPAVQQVAQPTMQAAQQEARPDFTLPDFMRPDMSKKKAKAANANMGSINEAFKSLDAHQAARKSKKQPLNEPKITSLSAEELVKAANNHSPEQAMSAQMRQPAPAEPAPAQVDLSTAPVDETQAEMAAMINEMREMRASFESSVQQPAPALKPLEHLPRDLNKAPLKTAVAEPAQPQQHPQMQEMLKEMRNMRSAFESQLTSLNWANISQRNPVKSHMLNLLLSAGFSATLSRQIAEKLPESYQGMPMNEANALAWIKHILTLNLETVSSENTLFDEGGVFALIGPTGVGKTTTTAKLAARYVMKHGTENLGIITTDAYRVGGHEQLRIYGKILGVMVHAVKDETDLKIALNELKNKHTILIDTVGVSQKDRMVSDQMAMLSSTNRQINKLLCINATSTGATLSDVVRAYKDKGLDGAILTKIDEAATIGNALDVVIRNKLKLYFATNGQRVPEDLIYSDKTALVEQALSTHSGGQYPYEFLEEELPFIMGQSTVKSSPEPSGA